MVMVHPDETEVCVTGSPPQDEESREYNQNDAAQIRNELNQNHHGNPNRQEDKKPISKQENDSSRQHHRQEVHQQDKKPFVKQEPDGSHHRTDHQYSRDSNHQDKKPDLKQENDIPQNTTTKKRKSREEALPPAPEPPTKARKTSTVVPAAEHLSQSPPQPANPDEIFKGINFLGLGWSPEDSNREDLRAFIQGAQANIEFDSSSNLSAISIVIAPQSPPIQLPLACAHLPLATPSWIQRCVEDNRLLSLDPQHYHNLVFRPLVNLAFGSDLSICFCGWPEGEALENLRHLVKIISGKYTIKCLKRNTHLVCRIPDGDEKCRKAEEFGIPRVSIDWLLQSAKEGKILDTDDFPVENHAQETAQVKIKAEKLETHNVFTHPQLPGPRILEGVTIYVSKKLANQAQTLQDMVANLGGSFASQPNDLSISHFLYNGKLDSSESDVRTAKKLLNSTVHFVSPAWLEQCKIQNRRLMEDSFPTQSSSSVLNFVSPKTEPQIKRSSSTHTGVRHQENTIVKSEPKDDEVETKPTIQPVEYVQDPHVVDSVNGKKVVNNKLNGMEEKIIEETPQDIGMSEAKRTQIKEEMKMVEESKPNLDEPVQNAVVLSDNQLMPPPPAFTDLLAQISNLVPNQPTKPAPRKKGKVLNLSSNRIRRSRQEFGSEGDESAHPPELSKSLSTTSMDSEKSLPDSMDDFPPESQSSIQITYGGSNAEERQKLIEKNDRERAERAKRAASPVFVVSSWKNPSITPKQCVERIGGEIATTPEMEKRATYFIIGVVSLFPKVLSALASGKPLLRPEYLVESAKAGRLLPNEKDFRWTVEFAGREEQAGNLIKASDKWVKQIEADRKSGKTRLGVFVDCSFMILGDDDAKASSILLAGGARLCETVQELVAQTSEYRIAFNAASHPGSPSAKVDEATQEELRENRIPIATTDWLTNFLMGGIPKFPVWDKSVSAPKSKQEPPPKTKAR